MFAQSDRTLLMHCVDRSYATIITSHFRILLSLALLHIDYK